MVAGIYPVVKIRQNLEQFPYVPTPPSSSRNPRGTPSPPRDYSFSAHESALQFRNVELESPGSVKTLQGRAVLPAVLGVCFLSNILQEVFSSLKILYIFTESKKRREAPTQTRKAESLASSGHGFPFSGLRPKGPEKC